MYTSTDVCLILCIIVHFLPCICSGFLLDNATEAPCVDVSNNCQYLNESLNVCSNPHTAKDRCKLYCGYCQAVDGGWSVWADWSVCEVTCGSGYRFRTRTCDNPPPAYGGDECVGVDHSTNVCILSTCPVHGGWGGWSQWGTCSSTCGVGLRRRDRNCDLPLPSKDGLPCNGDNINYDICIGSDCHVRWTDWSAWSTCSVTCDAGMQDRKRTCLNHVVDEYLPVSNCSGDSREFRSCTDVKCTPTIFFQAKQISSVWFFENRVVMFPSVDYNQGAGYSNSTGKFTAPVSGLYAFTKQTCTSNSFAYTAFVHNNQVVLASESRSSIHSCSSAQTFVDMSKGDQMWVNATSYSNFHNDNQYVQTSFAGALMQT